MTYIFIRLIPFVLLIFSNSESTVASLAGSETILQHVYSVAKFYKSCRVAITTCTIIYSITACAKSPADILFALDTSTSIGRQNFDREKQFVLAFVGDMDIGPSDVQVSVGTFSDNARGYFALNSHPNSNDLQAAIKGVSKTVS